MKQIKIHTPKPKTTLPRHEHAARRARAKLVALPATPHKSGPATSATTDPRNSSVG